MAKPKKRISKKKLVLGLGGFLLFLCVCVSALGLLAPDRPKPGVESNSNMLTGPTARLEATPRPTRLPQATSASTGVIVSPGETTTPTDIPAATSVPTDPPTSTTAPIDLPPPTDIPTVVPSDTSVPTRPPNASTGNLYGSVSPAADCDPSYPTVCIPSPPPDLDCGDIAFRNFLVIPPDPHRFDGNDDGAGCEN